MTTNQIKLSYVMTTYNKLPYLKEVMKRLLENVQEDEEIVITDGASTDGTVEYLTELYNQGKIHQFISEPDKGEAHGFNKGMLMARGELIKIITDDDVFYYPAIQECKKFMLDHSEVDVLGSLGAFNIFAPSEFLGYLELYENWKDKTQPFAFCGLGLLIRKKSLALTGLFHTSFIRVDAEFTYRITSSKVNLAWYTGLVWLHNSNSQSNSVKYGERMETEMKKFEQLYLNKSFWWIENKRYFVERLKQIPFLLKIKRFLFPIQQIEHTSMEKTLYLELKDQWDYGYNWLDDANRQSDSKFLYRDFQVASIIYSQI